MVSSREIHQKNFHAYFTVLHHSIRLIKVFSQFNLAHSDGTVLSGTGYGKLVRAVFIFRCITHLRSRRVTEEQPVTRGLVLVIQHTCGPETPSTVRQCITEGLARHSFFRIRCITSCCFWGYCGGSRTYQHRDSIRYAAPMSMRSRALSCS